MQHIEENKEFYSKMLRFFAVSSIGLIINTIVFSVALNEFPDYFSVYQLLIDLNLDIEYWQYPSAMIAILVTTIWNFVINKLWTFKEVETDKNIGLQTSQYLIVGAIGAVENLIILAILTTFFSMDPVIAEIIAFIITVFSNFILNYFWTFADNQDGN